MTSPAPVHAPLSQFPVSNGEICVGGIVLTQLARQAGGTPFYVYDRERIAQRVAEVRAILPANVQLHYAIKANPMPALLEYLAAQVDGFDVASAGEMKLALDAGMRAANIGFAGPGKRQKELQQAVAAGILVNAESERDIRLLADAKKWPPLSRSIARQRSSVPRSFSRLALWSARLWLAFCRR